MCARPTLMSITSPRAARAEATIFGQRLRCTRRSPEALRTRGARLFAERVFTCPHAAPNLAAARAGVMGDLDDGVPPTMLAATSGNDGDSAVQIQIHAVSESCGPRPVDFGGEKVGRCIGTAAREWLHIAVIACEGTGDPAVHARAAYERANEILHAHDMDFRCVARTWVWLRDILTWYGEFNAARTAVYQRVGLVQRHGLASYLPASTGIGVAPVGSAQGTLELIAMSDGRDSIRCVQSGSEQNSAFSYGSAFARATWAPMPTGSTLFVSGTAAIDTRGRSEHPADARAQIAATFRHVRALLADAGVTEQQIVSGIAYAKTPEVARVFAEGWSRLRWPRVDLIADICREELLFEIEVTAAGTADPCAVQADMVPRTSGDHP